MVRVNNSPEEAFCRNLRVKSRYVVSYKSRVGRPDIDRKLEAECRIETKKAVNVEYETKLIEDPKKVTSLVRPILSFLRERNLVWTLIAVKLHRVQCRHAL